ncbi:diguanylate cyclase (GGDEF)-like protein [Glaciihabitans tibetensis]|uniref:Diguanylate cyclase (GGDEF)-like protein n=1 Tax=Glaciihabitans tibetensis TaxID=1266600 RepID=A0A2T0VHC7_9MICO|nr:diguanylate cyclase [Glaciihabitans tibetensis]PRY69571.1 diguanylate cyclase (GGDEF)-like protein [Glaciihabitans tibetensis]
MQDEQLRLVRCIQEPIRAPGTIQPHGALLAVDAGTMEITVASDNCEAILGIHHEFLLGNSLRAVTGDEWIAANFAAVARTSTAANPLLLTIGDRQFEVIVHRGGPLVIVEFEPVPGDATSQSAQSAVAVYGAVHRLAQARSHAALWTAAARELQELTLFERVTIYSFHPDGHGEIVAEELAEGMEPYLGLHFPASDIPEQARQLYLTKLSRQIADSSGPTSALLSLPAPAGRATPQSLDLSSAELRSVSPHHLEFMRNMGQASTVSLSLVRDGQLIGMVTLAHRTPHRVPYLLRQGLEVLANQIALQLNSMDEIDRLKAQVRVRNIRANLVGQSGVRDSTDAADFAAALFSGELTVLNLIPANGAVLSLAGSITTVGVVPPEDGIAHLAGWGLQRDDAQSYVTESLPGQYPELATQLPGVTGLLFVPLPGSGDFIAWFRPEITETVKWLGAQTRDNRVTPLSPRTSFSSWTQSVSGKSAPWDGLEHEAEELSRDLAGALVRHAEAKLAALAMSDALTGLPNRRLLMDRLAQALQSPTRSGATSLLFIDLDSFKLINDTYGHDAGDQVLLETARRILDSTRAGDTVARLGGDEFVILCENTSTDDAGSLARRVIESLRQPIALDGLLLTVSASVGIADADVASTADQLLRGADGAMYRAKQLGRDQASR